MTWDTLVPSVYQVSQIIQFCPNYSTLDLGWTRMNDMAESYGGTTDGKPFDHAE